MSTVEDQTTLVSKRQIKKRRQRLDRREAIAADYDQYRAISFGAVVTMTLGGLSIPALFLAHLNAILLTPAALGVLVGAFTVLRLRGMQDEYIGIGYARTGLAVSALSLGIGSFFAIYTYATEVPEGYERISFSDLQPVAGRQDIPFSPKAEELTEKKVFVKGYVYPDGQTKNIKRFVLVPDMGTCCFGGQPKLTDMIQVTLRDPLHTEYSYSRRCFAGTFRLGAASADKVGNVIYHLDADYTK